MAICQKHFCELEKRDPKLEEDFHGIHDVIYVCPKCRIERQRFLTGVTRRMRKIIGRNITVEICPPGNHSNYFYSGLLEQVGDLVSSVTISGNQIVSFIDQEGLSPLIMEMDEAYDPKRPEIVSIIFYRTLFYKKATNHD
jgi:hypothetical protein